MNNANSGSSKLQPWELSQAGTRFLDGWTDDPLTSTKLDTTACDGRVAVITLSRPDARNAWTEIMRNEICRCLDFFL